MFFFSFLFGKFSRLLREGEREWRRRRRLPSREERARAQPTSAAVWTEAGRSKERPTTPSTVEGYRRRLSWRRRRRRRRSGPARDREGRRKRQYRRTERENGGKSGGFLSLSLSLLRLPAWAPSCSGWAWSGLDVWKEKKFVFASAREKQSMCPSFARECEPEENRGGENVLAAEVLEEPATNERHRSSPFALPSAFICRLTRTPRSRRPCAAREPFGGTPHLSPSLSMKTEEP